MSKSEHMAGATSAQQKILEQLQGGACTWDDLRELTKLNADNLGFIIMELLNQRKIWTVQKGDVRVYGIERRIGLVPRFAHERRRAS
jgi:predicted acyltransferase